jgi:hypothetical protein
MICHIYGFPYMKETLRCLFFLPHTDLYDITIQQRFIRNT